ncbi:hypothetical protein FRC08_003690 [Ceratobasidium sp. 394]|nr:hypothetical protein FRC08_003690 [Ceratobasidium sp. 394]KAG9085396.1 hypothetical protein FS749_004451 [Ceratobasidium sp. UAMH 11750]
MATSFDGFKGKIILHAQLTAQEGQADKAQALIKAVQADILAGKEPGCLTYRLSRHDNELFVFEEYENANAIKAHFEGSSFKALVAEIEKGTLTTGGPRITYYEEV